MNAAARVRRWPELCEADPRGPGLRMPLGVRVVCRCCGYPTLLEGAGEICPLCDWEDDDLVPGRPSAANLGRTLPEARERFERVASTARPGAGLAGGAMPPLTAHEREARARIAALFDEILAAADPAGCGEAWERLRGDGL